eukprot:Pgem_evm1s2213
MSPLNRATNAAREQEANRLLQTSFMNALFADPDVPSDTDDESETADGNEKIRTEIEDKLHSIMCGLDDESGLIYDKEFWLRKAPKLNIS